MSVGNPYPNPAPNGSLDVPVTAPFNTQVRMTGYTTTFKKVLEKNFTHPGGTAFFLLDLIDIWGDPLPNGVFYLKVELMDPSGRKYAKTLTLIVRR